jgi:hypothetical protein
MRIPGRVLGKCEDSVAMAMSRAFLARMVNAMAYIGPATIC